MSCIMLLYCFQISASEPPLQDRGWQCHFSFRTATSVSENNVPATRDKPQSAPSAVFTWIICSPPCCSKKLLTVSSAHYPERQAHRWFSRNTHTHLNSPFLQRRWQNSSEKLWSYWSADIDPDWNISANIAVKFCTDVYVPKGWISMTWLAF